MYKITLAMMAAVSLCTISCAKNDNLDPAQNAATAAQDRDLQEKDFASPCMAKPLAGVVASKMVYRFQGANMTRTTRYFKTADCSSDTDISFVEQGVFNLHTDQRTPDGGKAIDIDYKTVTVTTVTAQGVEAANAMGLCGAHDWSQNSQRDESSHAADVNCLNAEMPRHDSNIYRVDAKDLYFGATSDKSTDPSKRPASLDTSVKYSAP
jgi:hypothetical protein